MAMRERWGDGVSPGVDVCEGDDDGEEVVLNGMVLIEPMKKGVTTHKGQWAIVREENLPCN